MLVRALCYRGTCTACRTQLQNQPNCTYEFMSCSLPVPGTMFMAVLIGEIANVFAQFDMAGKEYNQVDLTSASFQI